MRLYGFTRRLHQRYQCVDCLKTFDLVHANGLPQYRIDELKESFFAALSLRKAAALHGLAKVTVSKYYKTFRAECERDSVPLPTCGCGKPVDHKGWCKERFIASGPRQEFVAQWGKS